MTGRCRKYALFFMLGWTVLLTASWWWNKSNIDRRVVDTARAMAQTGIDRDLALTRWAASIGGLYVPAAEVAPNPYLVGVTGHQISSKLGLLTLMNPEYILRLGNRASNVSGHFTSLDLRDPIDMPDAWESSALKTFRRSPFEIERNDEEAARFRLIRPIFAETNCRKCHLAAPGELMGGISVEVALAPLRDSEAHSYEYLGIAHGALWFFGIGLISFFATKCTARGRLVDSEIEGLSQKAAQFKKILDGMPLGVALLDGAGKCLFSNPAASAMAGEDLRFGAETRRKMLEALEKGEALFAEEGALAGEAIRYWLEPVGQDGAVLSFIDIGDFVREREEILAVNRGLEKRIFERSKELEWALQDLEYFGQTLSRDCREPLRAIDGFSQILLEDYAGSLDREGERLLGIIRRSVEAMRRILDSMAVFAEESRRPLMREEIDIAALAAQVFSEVEHQDAEFSLSSLPPASGDRHSIRKLLEILIGNAVKFSRGRQAPRLEMDSATTEGENVYSLRDNGVGFDMEEAARLFGLFQSLHPSHEFAGPAAGLALARRIVQKHGGRIWAEGKPGEGAIFYFTLPNER